MNTIKNNLFFTTSITAILLAKISSKTYWFCNMKINHRIATDYISKGYVTGKDLQLAKQWMRKYTIMRSLTMCQFYIPICIVAVYLDRFNTRYN